MKGLKKRNATLILLILLLPMFSVLLNMIPIPKVEAGSFWAGNLVYPFGFAYQRACFFDGTYWWLFLYDGDYKYSYSTNPLIWTNDFVTLNAPDGFYSRGGLDVAYDGDDRVMVSYGFYSSTYRWIAHNGTITGNSISWTRTQLDAYASYYQGLGGDYIPASGKFVYLTHRYDVSNPYVVYHNWTYPSGWTSDYQLDLPESINSNIGGTSVVGGGDIWMNLVMNGGAQLRFSIYDNTLGSVENNAKGGQASFSALPQGSVVHLVYLNSTDDIVYRRYDGSWGDREEVYAGGANFNSSFPVISFDETSDTIYVIWGDPVDDCIYVATRDSSGASGTWSDRTLVVDESEDQLYTSTKFGTGGLSVPEYMNSSQLPIFYVTKTGAPYTYKVVNVTTPAAPSPSLGENWLTGWDYRRQHNITGSTTIDQYDYQMRVEVRIGEPTTKLIDTNDQHAMQLNVNPKSIYYNGKTYFVWINTTGTWDLTIQSFTHSTATWGSVYSISDLSAEDRHLTGSIGVLPNGKLIVFYDCHGQAYPTIHYRISTNAEDESAWGAEQNLVAVDEGWSYPQPVIFDDKLVLFARETNGGATYNTWYKNTCTDGTDWTGWVQIVNWGTDASPYLRFSKEDDNILLGGFLYNRTTSQSNNVYFAYSDDEGSNWKMANGTSSDLSQAQTKIFDSAHETTYAYPSLDENGKPVVAFQRFDQKKAYLSQFDEPLGTSTGVWSTGTITDSDGTDITLATDVMIWTFVNNSKLMFFGVDASVDKVQRFERVSGYTRRFSPEWTDANYDVPSTFYGFPVENNTASTPLVLAFTQYKVSDTDWKIMAIMSNSEGADAPDNDMVYIDEGKCQDDFDDIRFTQSDGDTLLDIALETNSTGYYAFFWIEADEIPSTNGTVYLYYGNPSATSVSNYENTFIDFHNFDGQSDGDPPTDWTKQGVNTLEVDDAQKHSYNNSLIASGVNTGGNTSLSFTEQRAIEVWIRRGENDDASDIRIHEDEWVDGDLGPYVIFKGDGNIAYYDTGYTNLQPYEAGIWYRITIKDVDFTSDTYDIDINGINKADDVNFFLDHTYTSLDLFGFRQGADGGSTWADTVLLRRFVNPEPTNGAWGSEETLPDTNTAPSRGYYTVSFFEGDELYSDGEIGARFWFTATDPDGYADINEMAFALQIGSTWCNFTYDSSDPIGEGEWTKTTEQPYIEMFDDGWSGFGVDFTMFAWIRVNPETPEQYAITIYQKVTDASDATSGWGAILGNPLNIVEAPEDPATSGRTGPPPPDDEEPDIYTEPDTPPPDTDGDGILDPDDPDIDNDGVPNERDNDMDGDGEPNNRDPDLDGDGVPNSNDWGPYDPADRRMGAEEYGIQIGRAVYPIEDVWIRKNGSNIILLLLIFAFLMWTQREDEEDKKVRPAKKKRARGESLLEGLMP
jgi:hypothetical protein